MTRSSPRMPLVSFARAARNRASPPARSSTLPNGARGSACSAETARVALPRPRGFRLAVARGRRGVERGDEAVGGLRDLFDRAVEGLAIPLGGLRVSADLADELKRGGADFLVARGRLEVEERADVAAHRLCGPPAYW